VYQELTSVKVLHVIQRYPPAVGGSETWCRELCQYLAATGDEMKVLTFDVVEEEEFWRDPPIDQCIIRLGRTGLGRQGPREAIQAIPAHLQPLPFPSEGRCWTGGSASISMGPTRSRCTAACSRRHGMRTSSTSTPFPILTTSSGIWRRDCAESRSSSRRTFTRDTRTTSGGATTGC
jgi:hypothetical protein